MIDLLPKAVINDMTSSKGFIIRLRLQKRLFLPISLILKSLSTIQYIWQEYTPEGEAAGSTPAGWAILLKMTIPPVTIFY